MSENRQRILRLLTANAQGTGFFETLRLIEQLSKKRMSGARDFVELSHEPDLAFPVSDVTRVEVIPDKNLPNAETFRVACTFLGLVGTPSPLATHFTEQVLHRDEEDSLRAVYDVFHHMFLDILYRSWRDASLRGSLDQRADAALTKRCSTFVGTDPWAPTSPKRLPALALMSLSDYQRGRPESIDPGAAEALLQRIFPTLPIAVSLGHRRFIAFGGDETASLGDRNITLGEDVVYGAGTEDAAATVRVVIGPVHFEGYDWLMPPNAGYAAMLSACERAFGAYADIELEVIVRGDTVPTLELGGEHGGGELGVDARVAPPTGMLRVRVPLSSDPNAVTKRIFVEDERVATKVAS